MSKKIFKAICCILTFAMLLSFGIMGFASALQDDADEDAGDVEIVVEAGDEEAETEVDAEPEEAVIEDEEAAEGEDAAAVEEESDDGAYFTVLGEEDGDGGPSRIPANPNIKVTVVKGVGGYIRSIIYSGFAARMLPSLQAMTPSDFELSRRGNWFTDVTVDGLDLVLTVKIPFLEGSGYSVEYMGTQPVWLDFDNTDVDFEVSLGDGVAPNPASYIVIEDTDPLHDGPNVVHDPASITGYTGKFLLYGPTYTRVDFVGDLMLSKWDDPSDINTAITPLRNDRVNAMQYPPQAYVPGMTRRGGTVSGTSYSNSVNYRAAMVKELDANGDWTGYWYTELPLTAGANQYWYNYNGSTSRMQPDPHNMPIWSPASSSTKNAYNGIYIPYDDKMDFEPLRLREAEIPRTDDQTGILRFDRVTILNTTRYLGIYTPYGYDPDRAEPYKTIYMVHGSGQDESDWVNIGSLQHIMDNLAAAGQTEPALIVTMNNSALGAANNQFSGLFGGIIPYMEANYNVSSKAVDRSFGGLSMGASTTVSIINTCGPDKMGYWIPLSFSGGSSINSALANSTREIPRYFFADGTFEPILSRNIGTAFPASNAMYVVKDFAGAHDFNTWNQAFTDYARNYLWRPEMFVRKAGPSLIKDPASITGYTGRFVYKDEDAAQMYFCGDIMLSNDADRTDRRSYTPFEYRPGLMRSGGSYSGFRRPMAKGLNGYWYYEVPLAAGANQYWFNRNTNTSYMMPDPANHPLWSPNSNWSTKNAYNAIYVPYDPVQDYAPTAARVIENPRTDGQRGTWSYVPFNVGTSATHYLGVYLPYGYDPDRAKPYKTIYMQHGGGQDESDWMGIGSVQNIMDNLIADGLTEPALVVTPGSQYLGSGYVNVFNYIIPFIEANYNVSTKTYDRAFAGLSMGGSITSSIINSVNGNRIKYYGLFSGGAGSAVHNSAHLATINIFMGNGLQEGALNMGNIANTPANYDTLRVTGAHDFNTWCQLFTVFARDYVWKPQMFVKKAGPSLVADAESPTGYTGRFVYFDETADQMWFCGDLNLSNHADPSDTKIYSPFEYKPGLMRRGGSQFRERMAKGQNGLWYYSLPLAAGANQYWFNRNTNTSYMMPDPENHPLWSPNSNWNTKNAYNAIYVPYDPVQDYAPLAARVVENPRTDEKKGTWSYVPVTVPGYATSRYIAVYLPYQYDEDRAQPYKLIYMLHGAGQDESDWMGIGSVQNILDNLVADGLTEPAVLVSLGSSYFGTNFANLFNTIMPFVEDNYNVSADPNDRSFSGLSMGAMNASSLIRLDSSKFKYYGLYSGAQIGTILQGSNLNVPCMLIGDGLYEGGQSAVNLTNLMNAGANYKYFRVAGAHDFNTWNQLFTLHVRDYLWKPEKFIINNKVSITVPANTVITAGGSSSITFKLSVANLAEGPNAIGGTLTMTDPRFDISVTSAYPGVIAGYLPATGKFSLALLGSRFPDAASADLLDVVLTLKSGAVINNGDTVTSILNSIEFKYGNTVIPSVIARSTATTTLWKNSGVPGDVSGDGTVDLTDLSLAAELYGKRITDTNWYSSGAYLADINGDGIVDMEDVMTILYLSLQ